ncbi:iron-containing alcohol dehydrogenase [Hirsutella rhossiliensis]|uniref:Iron-containing alcohol dehydrogenase domain-containing protein n=1 Tax=Hirsutella rhossiliensis TaxID=111463 RepID=A0A9P8SKL9_9HYPO|nr:iron-containing alcohol dehydrogenase domain-containing protein [Hirsutella rhossiliensis]KAH0964910.1 iron-containing alcohol dehydrogenase domain-containing protein [Hirsutella rhossiliensis]
MGSIPGTFFLEDSARHRAELTTRQTGYDSRHAYRHKHHFHQHNFVLGLLTTLLAWPSERAPRPRWRKRSFFPLAAQFTTNAALAGRDSISRGVDRGSRRRQGNVASRRRHPRACTRSKSLTTPGRIAIVLAVLSILASLAPRRLHLSSPLIVSSPSRIALARRIQALVPSLDSRILDSAVVNVPARVVDDALDRISGRDVVISVGGASAVGLAKAIGGRKGIPHICIPTTYSGSEMMPLLLDTVSNMSTVRDPKILPTVIIYDEELTMSPLKRFSAPSDSAAMARSTELRACPSKGDETAQWSYIHLPGV